MSWLIPSWEESVWRDSRVTSFRLAGMDIIPGPTVFSTIDVVFLSTHTRTHARDFIVKERRKKWGKTERKGKK